MSSTPSHGRPEVQSALCFACGVVSLESEWQMFVSDQDADEFVPFTLSVEDAEARGLDTSDPMMRCPVCGWLHVDDDGNPGMFFGSPSECRDERAVHAASDGPAWQDRLHAAGGDGR